MRLLVPLIAIATLTGCSTLQRFTFQPPTFELTRIEVEQIGLRGGSLVLHLDVDNPNPYDLLATRMEVDVDLEQTPFGRLSLDEAHTLPSGDQTEVPLTLDFTWSGAPAGARGLLLRRALAYGLNGRVFFDTPMGERAVTLALAGEVPLASLIP